MVKECEQPLRRTGVAATHVSHHLGLLRMQNLITNRRSGKQVFYGLNGHVNATNDEGLQINVDRFVLRLSLAQWIGDVVTEAAGMSFLGLLWEVGRIGRHALMSGPAYGFAHDAGQGGRVSLALKADQEQSRILVQQQGAMAGTFMIASFRSASTMSSAS